MSTGWRGEAEFGRWYLMNRRGVCQNVASDPSPRRCRRGEAAGSSESGTCRTAKVKRPLTAVLQALRDLVG